MFAVLFFVVGCCCLLFVLFFVCILFRRVLFVCFLFVFKYIFWPLLIMHEDVIRAGRPMTHVWQVGNHFATNVIIMMS